MRNSIDVDVALEMSEKELYAMLGKEILKSKSYGEAIIGNKSLDEGMIGSVLGPSNKGVNAEEYFDDKGVSGLVLAKLGKKEFKEIWPVIKSTACEIHCDDVERDKKDLITAIITAVTSALNITSPWLVIVVTIAIRKGLDVMCKEEPSCISKKD